MIASISLIQRLADIDTAQFRRHWLDIHGPLVCKFPRLKRYIQSHVIENGAVAGLAQSLQIDGFAELWFANREDREVAYNSPELAACDIDSPAFIGQVRRVVTDPQVIVPLQRNDGVAKLMCVLAASETATPTQRFARQAAGAQDLPGLCGYVQHHALDQHRPPRSVVSGLQVDVAGLAEFWFQTAALRQRAIDAILEPSAALYLVEERAFI